MIERRRVEQFQEDTYGEVLSFNVGHFMADCGKIIVAAHGLEIFWKKYQRTRPAYGGRAFYLGNEKSRQRMDAHCIRNAVHARGKRGRKDKGIGGMDDSPGSPKGKKQPQGANSNA